MLSEEQCQQIELGLTTDVEPRKVAAYLCLHMGLVLSEVAALRLMDINLGGDEVTLNHVVGREPGETGFVPAHFLPLKEPRRLPTPPHVQRYLRKYRHLYPSGDCFILSGDTTVPPFHMMQNILSSINAEYKITENLSATDLRSAFVRRCIQSGMDLYSLCVYVGIKQPNVILKRYYEYFSPKLNTVQLLEQYAADYTPPKQQAFSGSKRMNLLILGAGSQGPVLKEIAEAIGIFHEIAFLDDDAQNPLGIGALSDYIKLVDRYPMAMPSFGDSYLREKWVDLLESAGYIVPTLIHPSASVSPSASIGSAVVVEAKCIISAGAKLQKGVLFSSGSVIEPLATVEPYAYVSPAVTVTKNTIVPAYTMVPSGTIVRG